MIQQFAIRNSSTLFFQSPIIFYEFLSLKGFVIVKLNRQSQALQIYNEVLKFNQFHYITLQRKQQLTGQKQEMILLLDNKSQDDNQFDNKKDQQQPLIDNKQFKKLKSIDRIFQSSNQRKSVIFKKAQNQNFHLEISIMNDKNQSNKQNLHTNQGQSRNNQQSAKKKGILKKTSFQINIQKDNHRNIQNQPFYLQLQKNSYINKHQVKRIQKRLSFDANKIKNIEGKLLSKNNFKQIEKNKQVLFEVQQIIEKQNNAQNISIKKLQKKKPIPIKRKRSLIEQSKFHRISKQIDLADIDQF